MGFDERGEKKAALVYSLIPTCKEHDVDPRTYLRDELWRIGKLNEVRELTPYGWKATWAPVFEAHRASIVERLVRKVDARARAPGLSSTSGKCVSPNGYGMR